MFTTPNETMWAIEAMGDAHRFVEVLQGKSSETGQKRALSFLLAAADHTWQAGLLQIRKKIAPCGAIPTFTLTPSNLLLVALA